MRRRSSRSHGFPSLDQQDFQMPFTDNNSGYVPVEDILKGSSLQSNSKRLSSDKDDKYTAPMISEKPNRITPMLSLADQV